MVLQDIKGLGKRKEEILKTMGIFSPEDLLYLFPKKFEDRRIALEPRVGSAGTFRGQLISKEHWRARSGRQSLKLHLAWEGYVVEVIFFNAPYLDKKFNLNEEYYFYGQLQQTGIHFSMVHPTFAPADQPDFLKLTPLYPYRKGLAQNDLANFIEEALNQSQLKDYLFEEDRINWKLMERRSALREMHFPRSRQNYAQAKYRLIFDDFFLFLLDRFDEDRPTKDSLEKPERTGFFNLFSFPLTGDQLQVLEDIDVDFSRGRQMQRLIQGDVGSGKSVPAYYAIWRILHQDRQVAYLAPTEFLARQQARMMEELFPGEVHLLIGSCKDKASIYSMISSGEAKIVVGTHALFEEGVAFKNLELVITDEQQRFGIRQRKALYDKGDAPHILMLSATPIPRTLSMILHQNLDSSYLREKPPGRQTIHTRIVRPKDLGGVYKHIEEEVQAGRKAFIVFPLIEESEKLDVISLEEGLEELRERFNDQLGVVHGRVGAQEKDEILEAFRRGDTRVLASTTVIEVGIDIPEASILLLRGAERFGLSQIHQIRGRIGRNSFISTCYLCAEKSIPERLLLLEQYDDGFKIAEEDLRLRGPGELRGIRQSGELNFCVADLIRHREVLERVSALMDAQVIDKYRDKVEALQL